jgi:MscS family membrane protein
MIQKNPFGQVFLGNTLEAYCWAIAILLAGLIFTKLISRMLSRLLFSALRKYSGGVNVNQFVELLTKPISLFVLLITVYAAAERLSFPTEWGFEPVSRFGIRMVLFRSFQTAILLSLTWIVLRIVDFFSLVLEIRASTTASKADDQLIHFIKEALKIIVVVFSFLFILGFVFNFNIATLVAGLGIGGLAIALAAKESLENLLGSFTIFFDKPFVVGDLVKVGNITGNVEKIGFRSTRIRTPEKSFVTVPNKKMVDAELDNLTLRMQRRAQFFVQLTYESTQEQIKAVINDIKHIINSHPHTDHREGRVYFLDFGESSLQIFVSYYVNSSDGDIFMSVKEEINFRIMETVQKYGTSFAYPTRMVYLHQNSTV